MSNDDTDLSDVCDRMQDFSREIAKLTRAVTAAERPVINVAASPALVEVAPKVQVTSPVTITAPVTVSPVQEWEFEITERDAYGYLKRFTARPKR